MPLQFGTIFGLLLETSGGRLTFNLGDGRVCVDESNLISPKPCVGMITTWKLKPNTEITRVVSTEHLTRKVN